MVRRMEGSMKRVYCISMPPKKSDLHCDECGECRKTVDNISIKETIMEQQEMTGMEKLKALPVVDRIIVMLNMLAGLQAKNMQLSGRPPLTKQIEIESAAYQAKARSY